MTRSVRRWAAWLAVLTTGTASPLAAQRLDERPALDPSIHTVLSGCRWQLLEREGTVRIVVRTGGYEHLISELLVQWLAAPTDPDRSATIVAESQPAGLNDHASVFTDLTLVHQGLNSCRITLTATNTHWDPVRSTHRVLLVGAPGAVRLEPQPQGE